MEIEPVRPAIEPWPAAAMRHPLAVPVVAALAFGLGVLAVSLAPPDTRVAAWWPAAGLCALALAWLPARGRVLAAAAFVVATGAANLVAGRDPVAALGFGVANTVEALLVAWWLTRTIGRPTLRRMEDVGRLVVAVLIGIAAMGLLGGLTVALLEDGSFRRTATSVMASHAAALLVLVPLGMLTPNVRALASRREHVALWAATIAVTTAVFLPGQSLPLTFAPLPLLVWSALRLTPRTAARLLLVLAVLVTALSRTSGPFHTAAGSGWAGSMLVQAYLVSMVAITIPLAVSVAQHRTTLRVLGASERLFRESFTESLLGMVLLRRNEPGLDVVAGNAVAARLLGATEDDVVGRSWSDLLAAWDRERVLDAVRLIDAERLDGWRDEVWLTVPHAPGGGVWVDMALSPLGPEEPAGVYVVQLVDVTARRREIETRLDERGLRDELTGLPGRALLADRTAQATLRLDADGPGLAVLNVDLVEFRHVNDTAGREAGDAALVEVARRLRTVLRPGDFLARPGGDEFTVLLPALGSVAEAEVVAGQVIDLFAEPVTAAGSAFALSVCVGIAWGESGASAEGLLRDAESAMHVARSTGRQRAVVHSDEHRIEARRVMHVERDLRGAVGRGELELWFQPVIDLHDGRTVAAEALVRWRHPERGLLAPTEWLDVAEETALMPEIGAWVLRESCREAARWGPGPGRAPQVHVNVSARQLEVPGFARSVHEVLIETGLPPERLVLEVTETQLDEIGEPLARDLAALRGAGIGLAADDFGTGYSPLTRLVDLPVTMIKIDRRFVETMNHDRRARAVVTALIGMSASLGLGLVAEGVESESQAAELRRLGCRHGQGYLWAPALAAEEFAAVLPDRAPV